jgi:hypothetical protein
MWQTWQKSIDRLSNFFGYFHVFQAVEPIRDSFRTNTVKRRLFKKFKKFHFWSIFANFSHILWKTKKPKTKKLVETIFFCEHFWVNKSLSMMWIVGPNSIPKCQKVSFSIQNFCGPVLHVQKLISLFIKKVWNSWVYCSCCCITSSCKMDQILAVTSLLWVVY